MQKLKDDLASCSPITAHCTPLAHHIAHNNCTPIQITAHCTLRTLHTRHTQNTAQCTHCTMLSPISAHCTVYTNKCTLYTTPILLQSFNIRGNWGASQAVKLVTYSSKIHSSNNIGVKIYFLCIKYHM